MTTKMTKTMIAVLALAPLLQFAGVASASRLAPEVETEVTPHQELMTFLMQRPRDPIRFAGKRVAIVVVDGTDNVTFELARDYLVEQGATVHVLGPRREVSARGDQADVPESSLVNALDYAGNARQIALTAFLERTDARTYDAVYFPGNHPDAQTGESNQQISQYAATAMSAGKPVFAIGDSPLLFARANLLRGRHATASRALQPFLLWAGAEVYDEPVVRDSLIYTSRSAFDLPKLMSVMMQLLTSPIATVDSPLAGVPARN